MFVNLVLSSGDTAWPAQDQGSLQEAPAHRHVSCSGSVPDAVCCPSFPSAVASWGKGGHESPCSLFLSNYSHMQAWERACTSSAETMFCPIGAAHHRSNHIHSYYNSGATSSLGLSRGLHPVNTVTTHFAPTLLLLQLQFRPKVPTLPTISRT